MTCGMHLIKCCGSIIVGTLGAWNIKSLGSFHGERVMRGKSHATQTAHGFTKSFRKTHLVALNLIQAKAYSALAVLSCSILPSASYLYRAFDAGDQPLMNTLPSTLPHNTPVSLSKKKLRAARRYVRRKHNAEGRTIVNKSKGKRHTNLHMFYLFKIPHRCTQHFGNISLLASSSVLLLLS